MIEVFNYHFIVCIYFLLKCNGLEMISGINWVHAKFKGGENAVAQIVCCKDRSFPGAEFFFTKLEIKFDIFGPVIFSKRYMLAKGFYRHPYNLSTVSIQRRNQPVFHI